MYSESILTPEHDLGVNVPSEMVPFEMAMKWRVPFKEQPSTDYFSFSQSEGSY